MGRLARMTKTLRMFRTVRFLSPLRLMFDCVVHTLAALFWAIVLLAFVLLTFGIFFVQSFADYGISHGQSVLEDDPIWVLIADRFGSVAQAMVSLLKVSDGGEDWGPYLEDIREISALNAVMFLVFILFFIIS